MEIYCTRPGCSHPLNTFSDLDDPSHLKTVQQKYCLNCEMPLILAGRYLPSQLLGKGGFGSAFLARDRYTPGMRQCVAKQFQPSGDLSPKALDVAQTLFEREAVALEELGYHHEQIPQLYAFFPLIVPNQLTGKDDQFFYLVQEYINGETIEAELAHKGIYSEAEVRAILEDLLRVLQYVHDNGSIHRDIKPSNIIRARNGRLYLLDFGAVKQVTSVVSNQPGRSTGIYSMGFAPPEQMSGGQVYPSTDLYAFAATCINLLTGKPPEELFESFDSSWNWQAHAPHASQELIDILNRMLLPTPKDRFQSANEVLEALGATPTSPPQPQVHPATPVNPPVSPASPAVTSAPTSPPYPMPPPIQEATPAPVAQHSPPPPLTPAIGKSRFSLLEVLFSAAFVGFEGALLVIILKSLYPPSGMIVAFMLVAALVYALYRRIVEGKDLWILPLVTLPILSLARFRGGLSFPDVLIVAILTAAAAIAITALFRLIYLLLRRLLNP
jgi:serine/threonine protein kinase